MFILLNFIKYAAQNSPTNKTTKNQQKFVNRPVKIMEEKCNVKPTLKDQESQKFQEAENMTLGGQKMRI